MFVWLLMAGIYYFFLGYPLYRAHALQMMMHKKKNLAAVALLYLLVGILIYHVIAKEQFVYYWDYGKYYQQTLDIKQMYQSNAWEIIRHVYHTSVMSDYGAWIPSILALPFRFTPGRFVDYIMLLYAMFAVPGAFSLSVLGTVISGRSNKYFFLVCNFVILLMPWYLQPLLAGYPGIAAFVPLACSMWIFYQSDGMYTIGKTDAAVLSGALLAAALLRRYFCFYILGFVCGGIAYSICNWWRKRQGKAAVRTYLINYLRVGIASLLVLVAFFHGFLQRVLLINYSEMYVAYNVGDMVTKYVGFFHHLGILLCVLLLISIIMILLKQKEQIPLLVFCIVFEITTTVCFFHVQSPGVHHYWIFLLPLLLLFFVLAGNLVDSFSKQICILAGICFLYNTIYVFGGGSWIILNPYLCQRDVYASRQRSDISELKRLSDYVQSIQSDQQIYCLASSRILNDDILKKLYLPEESALNLTSVSHVDLRDGFPVNFFDADIVVTTNPVQTHLPEGTQQVITILHKELTNEHSRIGRHFVKKDVFQLAEGVEAIVYSKTNCFTAEEIQYLENLYESAYPDQPTLFRERFEKYLHNYESKEKCLASVKP